MIWIYLHRESGSCLRLLFQLAEDPKSNKSPLRAAAGWFVIPFINRLTGNVSLIYTIDQPLKSFSNQYRNYWLFLVRLMWRFGAFYVFSILKNALFMLFCTQIARVLFIAIFPTKWNVEMQILKPGCAWNSRWNPLVFTWKAPPDLFVIYHPR